MENKLREVFPGWQLVRQIGTDHSGSVYEICRRENGAAQRAALKVVTVGNDSQQREQILREHQILSDLGNHPHIVHCDSIRRAGENGGELFIKMELLTPMLQTLGSEISSEQVVALGMDVAAALMACKSRGVIHCDVKPQNILLAENGSYKLGNFRSARTVEASEAAVRPDTFNFTAPELYANRPCDERADVYSLGMVMYWMLNRRRGPFLPLPPAPFTAAAEETARQRRFAGEQMPPPMDGSAELRRIVLKACAFDPAERYASAADLMDELKKLKKNMDADRFVGGVVASVVGKDAAFKTVALHEEVPLNDLPPYGKEELPEEKAVPEQEPRKKKKGLLIALIAIIVVAAAVLALALIALLGDHGGGNGIPDTGTHQNSGVKPDTGSGGSADPEPDTDPDEDPDGVVLQPVWSEWTDTLPDFVFEEDYLVETAMQYRSAPLYYYIGSETLTDDLTVCYTGYGEWSSRWSDWQTTPVKASDLMEVQTGTRYWYRDGWYEYYNDIRRDTPENPWIWYWGEPKYSDNEVPAKKDGRERLTDRDQTIYRYRSRPRTYYCIKESEWSEWSDEVLLPAHDTMVNTRVVYRYAQAVGEVAAAALSNFPETIPAYTSRFTDVPNDKWYGAEQGNWVGIAVEIGAMSADEYLRFRPEENITIGELIKAAVSIRRTYSGVSPVMEKTTPWYGAYVDYAIEMGIIEAGVFSDFGKTATRAEAAYILGRVLPEAEYGKVNTVRAITDMDAGSSFFKSVWRLAESGVISWPDPEGAFEPDRSISRAEVAAMIGRVVYPAKRVSGNG